MFEILFEDQLRHFLKEDLGVEGDVTSKVLDLGGRTAAATVVAREPGTVAGLHLIEPLFKLLDSRCQVESRADEGSEFEAGASLLLLTGPAQAVLSGERTALNLLSRMFGIATTTRRLSNLLVGTGTRLLPTRKTLPGFRFFDKYAVKVGGADRHRYGLNDAVMIKDNHLSIVGGVSEALRLARLNAGHMLTIELECDTLEQLREALRVDREMFEEDSRRRGVDVVLLDNMSLPEMSEAVAMLKQHPRTVLCEASGGISAENLRAVADTGVDFISMGALTHTVTPIDLGLDFLAT